MGKSRDRANRSGSDPVNIGTTRLAVDSGNVKVTAQDGTTFKKIFAEEVQVGVGNNRVILKRGSDGKAEFQSTADGGGSTTNLTVGGSSTVTNPSDLPITGNQAGDTILVTSNNNLMIYNGSGWYKIATITNATPTISSAGNASYTFATDGTPVSIEITASDPEGVALQYKYQVTTGSLGSTAAVTNSATSGGTYSALAANTYSNNRFFKVTPSTNSAHAGAFAITFSVTDGVNTANSSASSFTLAFEVSGSLRFDGTGDYITVPSSTNLQLGSSNFTVEFWLYLPVAIASNYQIYIGKGHNADSSREWYLEGMSDGKIDLFWSTNGGGWSSAEVTGVLPIRTWHHIVMQRTGSTLKVYTNGNESYVNSSFPTIHSGSQILNIGGFNDGSGLYSNSFMSNVRLIKGSNAYTTTGGSINLTPSNANVSLATDADYLIGSSEDFTIEAWVYTPSSFALNNAKWRTVYFCGTNGALQIAYDTAGKPVFYSGGNIILATTASTASTWEHIAFTRTGSSMVFYRNGVADGTATNNAAHGANTNAHYIGAYSGTEGGLGGYISNFRFVVGTGVYTGAFTPPHALTTSGGTYASTANVNTSFTASHTMILTGQSSSSVTDASQKNETLTLGSSAAAAANSPFITVPTEPISAISNTMLLVGTEKESVAVTDGAYSFDAVTSRLKTPDSSSGAYNLPADTPMTLEMWYYMRATPANSVYLWSLHDYQVHMTYYSSYSSHNQPHMQLYLGKGGSTRLYGNGNTGTSLNTWYHVAVTRNSSNVWNMYIDGVKQTLGAGGGAGGSQITNNSGWTGASEAARIGINCYPVVSSASWAVNSGMNGALSDIRWVVGTCVYSDSFTPPSGPLTKTGGTYPSNTNINTSITSSHTKMLTAQSSGVAGGLEFTGSGETTTASHAGFDFGSNDFTVEFWYKWKDNSGYQTLIDQYYHVGARHFLLQANTSTTKWGVFINQTHIGSAYESSDATIGIWHHYAIVRNGSAFKMYRDGVETISATVSGSLSGTEVTKFNHASHTTSGSVSNLRVVKGTAVYTSAGFTLPTGNLTAISGTSLLLFQENSGTTLDDGSTNNVTITKHSGHNIITGGGPYYWKDNSDSGFRLSASGAGNATKTTGVTYPSKDISTQNNSLSFKGDTSHSFATPFSDGGGGSTLFCATQTLGGNHSGHYADAPDSAQFSMGTGDFTIEGWVYPYDQQHNRGFWALSTTAADSWNWNSGNSLGFLRGYGDSGNLGFYGIGNEHNLTTTVNPAINTWFHFAFVRISNTLKIYIDGVEKHSATDNTNYTGDGIKIGGLGGVGGVAHFNMSNFRIVKGTGVYTSAFSVPTSPLTAITNTVLLTCNDSNKVDDASTSGHVITTYNDVIATRFHPF